MRINYTNIKTMRVKKLGLVGFITLVLLSLVIVRSLNHNHFVNNLTSAAEPSLNTKNVLTIDQLNWISVNPLFVVLDGNKNTNAKFQGEVIYTASNSILKKDCLRKMQNHKGTVVLVSKDPAVASEIWMILSQMGIKNLYQLSDAGGEQLKYEFRPDSAVRPES